MSAFAKSSFNTRLYSAARPTYPCQLYDLIFRYHEHGSAADPKYVGQSSKQHWRQAVDLGCGTGQATVNLVRFQQVYGVDPSRKMLNSARKYVDQELARQGNGNEKLSERFKFIHKAAEDLSFLRRSTVDLIVAAQAAHWFDWKRLWPELARVMRQHGTLAIWGYSEMRFTRYPSLTPLIDSYTHGTDRTTSLGPHWQQPGRSIVENLLRDIPHPDTVVHGRFYAERRVYFSGPHFPEIWDARPVVMRKKMPWDVFEAYLRSFSSLHSFQAENRDDAKHPDGDIVQRFIKSLKDGMLDVETHRTRSDLDSEEVEIEWPLALILFKRTEW